MNNTSQQNLRAYVNVQNLHQVHNPIANQTANLEGNDNEQSEQNSEEVSNGSVVLQQPHTTTTSPFYRGVAFTFYPLMFMLHPILNIFPCYTTRQLERGIIKPDDTQLKDCRGNSPISFGPASKFTSSKIQCNLEFRAPNGKFYNAPYAFVRNVGNEFEIPNLYKPTLLENKRLKAVICTSSEQEPSIHPMYKIMNQLGRTVDSLLININEYTSM
ncbi:unnamed protein product [Adineta steineri]|uniref:Uncharacterized protein n=1 Tax=Adineta steineri TaxID=433720 RepID=A0A815I2X0_9BILA|nr:unnamed protein product [Adineta steineri]